MISRALIPPDARRCRGFAAPAFSSPNCAARRARSGSADFTQPRHGPLHTFTISRI